MGETLVGLSQTSGCLPLIHQSHLLSRSRLYQQADTALVVKQPQSSIDHPSTELSSRQAVAENTHLCDAALFDYDPRRFFRPLKSLEKVGLAGLGAPSDATPCHACRRDPDHAQCSIELRILLATTV